MIYIIIMEVLAAVILAMTVLILNVYNRDIDTPVPAWVRRIILRSSQIENAEKTASVNPWRELASKLDRIGFCLTFGYVVVATFVINILLMT